MREAIRRARHRGLNIRTESRITIPEGRMTTAASKLKANSRLVRKRPLLSLAKWPKIGSNAKLIVARRLSQRKSIRIARLGMLLYREFRQKSLRKL